MTHPSRQRTRTRIPQSERPEAQSSRFHSRLQRLTRPTRHRVSGASRRASARVCSTSPSQVDRCSESVPFRLGSRRVHSQQAIQETDSDERSPDENETQQRQNRADRRPEAEEATECRQSDRRRTQPETDPNSSVCRTDIVFHTHNYTILLRKSFPTTSPVAQAVRHDRPLGGVTAQAGTATALVAERRRRRCRRVRPPERTHPGRGQCRFRVRTRRSGSPRSGTSWRRHRP